MRFSAPKTRAPQDRAIVPMINVVFLLLIFFLMSATLAPPDPFEVMPPTADGSRTDPLPGTLYISAAGDFAFNTARNEAVWPLLATLSDPLPIRADAAWPATDLAALLPRLAAVGITDILLLTVSP